MFTKNKADEYVLNNKNKINREFKPEYHFSAEIGWINDPNGFCRFNGRYHLFYQFYPYSSLEGNKHWGHAVSDDLIKWEHLPVALAPDSEYDKDGCWSGTAIVLDNTLYLIYTGVHDGKQEQCVAFSRDGVNFEKYAGNPVIGEKNPAPGVDIRNFRDPKIIKRGGNYYCIIGAEKKAAVYKSKNSIFDWEYAGDLLDKELGAMWECPDYFGQDGETVFIASVCGENQENKDKDKFIFPSNPTYFILENNGLENLPVKYKYFDELENGFDFYAPQTLSSPDGENIIIAWMYTFGKRAVTDAGNLGHGWAHCLTLPREISIRDGRLYQNPVKSIEKYRQNMIIYENINIDRNLFKLENNKCSEIIISADISETDKFTIILPAGVFEFDKKSGSATFDRTNCGHDMRSDRQIKNNEPEIRKIKFGFTDILDLRIFIDVSAAEIFINGGEKVISSRFYPEDKSYNIIFKSESKINIKEIRKYDIVSGTPLNIDNADDIFRLDGKTAIVTGASRGIGRAIALRLAKQGADLLLVARDLNNLESLKKEIINMGQRAESFAVDVGDAAQVLEFFKNNADIFGGVDILINNAAYTVGKSFTETSLEEFDGLFNVNVKGAVSFMQGAAECMKRQGKGGCIVVVTSINALNALPGQAMYSATKSMLESLMKSAAAELAEYGIRVNSIVPGAIRTDMNPHFTEGYLKEYNKKIPAGRVGEPEDIADVTAFLCSDAARYIYGSSIVVDGGMLLRPLIKK